MNRTLSCLLILAFSVPALAAVQRPVLVTTQDHSLVTIDDCEHFYARTLTSFPSQAQSEEQRAVQLAGIETIRVRGSEGGGVSIRGWDRPVARLTLCKYAAAGNDADARKLLREVSVTTHNGEVLSTGPAPNSSRVWWVHMILRVPRRTAVDVSATGGGIAIRNMSGPIKARSTNGGISLASCAGENSLSTDNGGISLEKITGRTSATTQNGTIALKVGGEGCRIEARTDDENEILCRANICASATSTTAGGTRVLRIGSVAQPLIRLTAGSAPIVIEQLR